MKKILLPLISVAFFINMSTAQRVGIGTTTPDSTLTVVGSTRIHGNTLINGNLQLPLGAAAGKVLESDASGNAAWVTAAAGMPAGTAVGQMLYWSGNAWVFIPPGSGGQVLQMRGPLNSNQIPMWVSPENLVIGQQYQGGVIASFLYPGDPGYDPNVTHGLIAAPTDLGCMDWSNGSYVTTGATATAIGSGNANTNSIVFVQLAGSYAAKLCDDLVLGGYNDWYLPSKDELNRLYTYKNLIGSFASSYYWSSSEFDNGQAWGQQFLGGFQSPFPKHIAGPSAYMCVRAVRSF